MTCSSDNNACFQSSGALLSRYGDNIILSTNGGLSMFILWASSALSLFNVNFSLKQLVGFAVVIMATGLL